MTKVPFSSNPGRHERHFMRKHDNPLFPRPLVDVDDDEIIEAQRLDHEELLTYVTELRALVQQAIELKPNEESQVILDLKAELDKSYEKACTMADDQEGNKQALQQLINVIMRTIRVNAAGDSMAEQQLNEEEQARAIHFNLLEQPIVADLLDPASLIEKDELVPSLLNESEEGLAAALALFDEEQRAQLVSQAGQLLEAMDTPSDETRARFEQLRG